MTKQLNALQRFFLGFTDVPSGRGGPPRAPRDYTGAKNTAKATRRQPAKPSPALTNPMATLGHAPRGRKQKRGK